MRASRHLIRLQPLPQLPRSRHIHATTLCAWEKYDNERHFEPGEDVLKRVWHGLTYDVKRWKRRYQQARDDAFKRNNPIAFAKRDILDHELLPHRTEVLIIGGGLTGSSTAYWIKERFRDEDFKVTVVESPDKLEHSRTMLSNGAITQQFSIPEFIDMSLFSAEFLRHAGEHLKILDNDPPDINLLPVGFMYLARTPEEAETMRENWRTQIERGVKVAYYTKSELAARFPFMNFDDVIVGTYGLENEGLIDTWQLLSAIREKNISLGVQYFKGAVESFLFDRIVGAPEVHSRLGGGRDADLDALQKRRIRGVNVRPQMVGASARPVRTNMIVNAAGPWAGEIARMAGIGQGEGLLAVPIPIEPRKRVNFVIHAPDVPSFDIPAFTDPNGIFCRPQDAGSNFIVGKIPTRADDAKTDHTNLSIDYDDFYNNIWPVLVSRVPAFKTAKVINAWAMYNDVNTFDDTPIMGEHLLFTNLYTMAGFANYGPQMSIAMGRLFAERIFEGAYTTVNVRKFDMRRIMHGNKVAEPLKCAV
uniref:FAD-dependent oxidoreductase domain-containing protein 1 n=1 Tax=Panagrellus redivivus TaxID=6233 RepID=A0A7E4V1K9_PANRE